MLDLHPDVQKLIQAGRLSAGHGRALLGLSDVDAQQMLARKCVTAGWSVRMAEQAVRRSSPDGPGAKEPKADRQGARAAHLADLEEQLRRHLQTQVRIRPGRKKNTGTLMVEFYNLEQFDHLLQKLGVNLE